MSRIWFLGLFLAVGILFYLWWFFRSPSEDRPNPIIEPPIPQVTSIRLWDREIIAPQTSDELFITSWNQGSLILNGQIFRLPQLDIPAGWWRFSSVVDICDAPDGGYFILSDALYYVDEVIQRIAPARVRISLRDEEEGQEIQRVFFYAKALHVLAGQQLYRGLTRHDLNKYYREQRSNDPERFFQYWGWERVQYLRGRDISHLKIHDLSLAEDGALFLVDTEGHTLLNQAYIQAPAGLSALDRRNGCWLIDSVIIRNYHTHYSVTKEPTRHRYGSSVREYLKFQGQKVSLIHHDQVIFSLKRVKDAIIDPRSPFSVYILTLEGGLRRYSYYDNLEKPRLDREFFEAEGERLFRTGDTVWLGSGYDLIRYDGR